MRTMMAVVLTIVLGHGGGVGAQRTPAELAFERLKGLVGTWDAVEAGTSRKFASVYTLTGGGQVVMEVLGGMSTAYHFDNGTLLLTHFCGAGNQPRMRVKTIEPDGRRIVFDMYDITNLKSPDAYRSTWLDVRFHIDGTVDLAYGVVCRSDEYANVPTAQARRIGPPTRWSAMTHRDFLSYHSKARARTMRLVPLIPETSLEWRPVEGAFSFGDVLRHLAGLERWMWAENVQGRPARYPGHQHALAPGYQATLDYVSTCWSEARDIFGGLGDDGLQRLVQTPGGATMPASSGFAQCWSTAGSCISCSDCQG